MPTPFFYAMTEPAEKTLVANLVGQEHRGLAYGWYNCGDWHRHTAGQRRLWDRVQDVRPLAAFGSGAGLALAAAILLASLPMSPLSQSERGRG